MNGDRDSVTPISMFFEDFLPDILLYPSMSLSSLWTLFPWPGASLCLVSGDGDGDDEDREEIDEDVRDMARIVDKEFHKLLASSQQRQRPRHGQVPARPGLGSGASRLHDPMGILQKLFNLSESQLLQSLKDRRRGKQSHPSSANFV
jgi:hypothetical protein